jgi:hypothetical protein
MMAALRSASLLLAAALAAGAATGPQPLRRFALAVGANDGGPSRLRLRYAGSDAANFVAVMERFGGIARGDAHLLNEPGRAGFLSALAALR